MSKRLLFLIILGIFIFSVRLSMLNEAIYDDESNFAYSLTVMDSVGFNHHYYSPQPLNLLYHPFVLLFGLNTWVFRLLPWLFAITNTIFVYIFARRNFGEKTAFWSTFLMLFAFYPTLASLQFDVEGNLIMFCFLLMTYSYLEHERAAEKNDQRRSLGWQIAVGVGLGVAVISKYNAIYAVVILGIYSLVKRQWKVKDSFRDLFLIYFVGLALFLCYVLLAMAVAPTSWLNFVGIISPERYYTNHFSLLAIALFLLWATPLLMGLFLLSLIRKDFLNYFLRANRLLLLFWLITPLLFYTFVITSGSIDRYLMNTIPVLALLGGSFLAEINLKKKELALLSISTLFFTSLFFFLNLLPSKLVARFPELYFQELQRYNLNFLFTYTSASGPTFAVNFVTIAVCFIFSFIALFSFFLCRNKVMRTTLFVLFFSVSLAFNVFLISEYVFHPTSANVSEVKWQMINYVKDNHLSLPIYTNDQGIQWYFEHDYLWQNKVTQGFADNEIGDNVKPVLHRISQEGGTIFLLHWPPLPENSPAWDVVKPCYLQQQFYDKGILVGEVYRCEKK